MAQGADRRRTPLSRPAAATTDAGLLGVAGPAFGGDVREVGAAQATCGQPAAS